MIRIAIVTCDYGAAANIGGPVVNTLKTFDLEAPEVEKFLLEYEMAKSTDKKESKLWWNRSVAGVEIINHKLTTK
jgi:hypothetical protein